MKTYEEIMANLFEYHFKNVSPGPVDIKKQAAKEYAKQWVVTAVALAGIDRTVEKNESTVRLIQSKIDAQ